MSGLLLVSLAMVAIVSAAQARPSAPVTAADDVRELGTQIAQIHPDAFRSVSRQRFEADVSALAQRAPSISQNELLVGMLRIIASLGPRNGHTGLFPGDPTHTRELHFYPVRLYDFADGMYVVDATDRSLIRNRLVAIEGIPIERVLELVEPLVPRDNTSNLRGLAPHYLLTAEVLDGLGVADGIGAAELTFEQPDGQRVDVELTAVAASRYIVRRSRIRSSATIRRSCPQASQPLYLSGSARPLWARTLAVVARSTSVTTPSARRRPPFCERSSDSCGGRAFAGSSWTCDSTVAATTRRTARSRRSSARRQ